VKQVLLFFLLLLLVGCYRDGRSVIIAAHDISPNTVIENADIEAVNSKRLKKSGYSADIVRDRRDIVGHRTLRAVRKGDPFQSSDFK
jgi:flagella basal body P-ring formation protein FlgA